MTTKYYTPHRLANRLETVSNINVVKVVDIYEREDGFYGKVAISFTSIDKTAEDHLDEIADESYGWTIRKASDDSAVGVDKIFELRVDADGRSLV